MQTTILRWKLTWTWRCQMTPWQPCTCCARASPLRCALCGEEPQQQLHATASAGPSCTRHRAELSQPAPCGLLLQAKVAPFATKAQLYTVLNDRTAVDRQLDELRRSNAVRVLQVNRVGCWGMLWVLVNSEMGSKRCWAQLSA